MILTEDGSLRRIMWVICVLDDAEKKSIEYSNRLWLRQNIAKYRISISVEDSMVYSLEEIKEYLSSKGSFIIQEGKKFWARQVDSKLDPRKEAIICWKVEDKLSGKYNYLAFLYRPKDE